MAVLLSVVFFTVLSFRAYQDVKWVVDLQRVELKEEQRKLAEVISTAFAQLWKYEGKKNADNFRAKIGKKEGITEIDRVSIKALTRGEFPQKDQDGRSIARRLEQQEIIQFVEEKGNRTLYTYARLDTGDGGPQALVLKRPLRLDRRFFLNLIIREVVTLVAVVALFVVAVLLAGRFLVARPIKALISQTDQVAGGNSEIPPLVTSVDESAILARKISQVGMRMKDISEQAATERRARKVIEEQLRHANRLASAGTLAAGIIHDLGTPLNIISGRASMIGSETLSREELDEHAQIIVDQSKRITNIVRQLLRYVRPGSGPVSGTTDVLAEIREHLLLIEPMARKAKVTTGIASDSVEMKSVIGATRLRQIINNLVSNAIQAMPNGGVLTVGTSKEKVSPPSGGEEDVYASIYVQDQGVGIPEQNREKVFEPFFTTKSEKEGSGLGLSVCQGILREYGGWISVESEPGRGTRFTVYFPEKGES